MIALIFDPLVTPVYYYVLGYLAVFVLAVIIAHLGANENRLGSYERATHIGWLLGFLLHLAAGGILISGSIYRAIEESTSWGNIVVYMTPYGLVMGIDFVCLIMLIKRMSEGKSREN